MSKNILIVEDEEEILDILGEHVKDLDAIGVKDNIFLASDGLEASKICNKIRIDALVTDLNMPNKSGQELIKELREKYGDSFPVFVLTAYSSGGLQDELENIKAVKVYKKPLDVEEMLIDLCGQLNKL